MTARPLARLTRESVTLLRRATGRPELAQI
jgi:hypothetical protein